MSGFMKRASECFEAVLEGQRRTVKRRSDRRRLMAAFRLKEEQERQEMRDREGKKEAQGKNGNHEREGRCYTN